MIDFVFRYDAAHAETQGQPADAQEARRTLIEGNRVFSQWMATCRVGESPPGGLQYVVPCTAREFAFAAPGAEYPVQRPFATVLGCSDARVPTEMLFGQGFNELFVIRVAGNVLGEAVQGSLDFSVVALGESVRVLVALGHTNCGAVRGAVEAYLDPKKFWSKDYSPSLRLTFQRIFVAVRESDNALRQAWGPDAPARPGYREALTDMAVCINAAHTAFALRQQVEAMGRRQIGVLFGVYDIRTHQVCMPLHPDEPPSPEHVDLADAPADPGEIAALAADLAVMYGRRRPSGPAPSPMA